MLLTVNCSISDPCSLHITFTRLLSFKLQKATNFFLAPQMPFALAYSSPWFTLYFLQMSLNVAAWKSLIWPFILSPSQQSSSKPASQLADLETL